MLIGEKYLYSHVTDKGFLETLQRVIFKCMNKWQLWAYDMEDLLVYCLLMASKYVDIL